MRAIVALAQKIGPTDIPVLIAGATGTGKEVVAELIHASSTRKSREILCINCAGLPTELIESELFGSVKGAYTSSATDRVGLITHAAHSTLFLDELSEMPLTLQSKLLRFLQDKQVRRVGGVMSETVDVRVIASINKEPRHCIKEKTLREDLYYRLSAITIVVPLLRDRPQDIMPLVNAYLNHFCAKFDRKIPYIPSKVEKTLLAYSWPGNVRQLQNEMTRCAILCEDTVRLEDLSIQRNSPVDETIQELQRCVVIDVDFLSYLERAELKTILGVLETCNYNKQKACKQLRVGRQTLYNKIHRYGIKIPDSHQLTSRILPQVLATVNSTLLINADSAP